VPESYDPAKFYPVLFILGPGDPAKADTFVSAWAETSIAKSWILAAWHEKIYDWEESIKPFKDALATVKATYHVDERRVVLAGHNAGAGMAWRLFTREPTLFAGIVAFGGQIPQPDRDKLKPLAGKPVYIFRGEKDTYYTADMLETDKKYLEVAKITPTVDVRKGWGMDYSRDSIPPILAWLENVWPPGAYREKADAAAKALAAKDLAAAYAAVTELTAELKKNPYPAFDGRRAALEKELLEAGREKIAEGRRLLEGGQPLLALEAAEAAVKALKGMKPLDAEAASTLASLKKDPAVVAAVRKKEAEASAASYMEKAGAAEAKGDLAKALDWYRRVVALGDTSRKAEAEQKVAEIEPKVPPK
jgi:predicted esterase